MGSFLAEIGWLDLIAAAVLFASYVLYAPATRLVFGDDIRSRMMLWRVLWARQMLWREERITDVSIVRGLIGNVSFFATTTIFVISGLVALLGASPLIADRINELPHFANATDETVALKISALLALAVVAFFKFGWAMRLHAYSLMMVGAAPEPGERQSELAEVVASRLAEMSALASRNFLGGVRAYYFGFAALPWLFSAWLFFPVLGLAVVVAVHREFMSKAFEIATFPGIENGPAYPDQGRSSEKDRDRLSSNL